MSIYRGHRPLPSDVQVRQVSNTPPVANLSLQSSPQHLRKAQPALVLLPRTAVWIALLPKPVRPSVLASHFARIANHVCAVWEDPPACRKYLAQLLANERGGRQGFPTMVLREIEALQTFHAHLHVSADPQLDWGDSLWSVRHERN